MRGDHASRSAYYVSALQNGWMTINEIRELENLNPIGPEGDQHFVPLNMTTLEKAVSEPEPQPQEEEPAMAEEEELSEPGEEENQQRSTISIDFDRTFSANPKMWGEFAKTSSANGDTVVMISRRPDDDDSKDEVMAFLGDYASAFSQVLLIGDQFKDVAAKNAGIEVDIWIDDAPQFIKHQET